ncbi:hypothetical protein ACVISU_006627 [Bradyrhizobium sp. USDA 4452]
MCYFLKIHLNELARGKPSDVMSRCSISASRKSRHTVPWDFLSGLLNLLFRLMTLSSASRILLDVAHFEPVSTLPIQTRSLPSLLKRQIAVAIELHQFGRNRAQSQALPYHMRGHAEASRDLLRTEPALVRELSERLELVGRMHALPGDVLVQADLVRIVRGIDDAGGSARSS